MKVAHLILAHKNPGQLERLINVLNHPDFYFYIHIDGKTDALPFNYLFQKQNVFLVRNRAKIYWAGWGTIQATINGFKEILPLGYRYINVISAQDYPLKPAAGIYDYLKKHEGFEFITCQSIDGDEWSEAAVRIKKYSLINWRIPGKFFLEKVLNRITPVRKFPFDHKIVGRANWFTLSSEAVRYSLDFIERHPKLSGFYKYSWGADEFIFSTILYNSPFKDRLLDNLVYVDWSKPESQGHPKILTVEDIDALKTTDKMFARKFDMKKDSDVLDQLEDFIGFKKEVSAGNNNPRT